MNAPGANNKPTAPNLANVSRRLQRRWTYHWVQEPAIIQVGTLMPPFFTGMPVYNLVGQPWPLGGGGNEADTEKVLAKYHTPDVRTQKNLLLDYLYETGQRPTYVAKQPAEIGGSTTQPATQGAATQPAAK